MNRFVSRGLMGVLFTGGLLALGAGVAHAAEAHDSTSGSDSVLGGSQLLAPITAPITGDGNAVAVLGQAVSTRASAPTSAPASPAPAATPPARTSGGDGVASGTQAVAPVSIPITAGGNSIAVLGHSRSTAPAGSGSTPDATGSTAPASGAQTSGHDSAAGGTQVVAPVSVPVTVGGNAIGVLGHSRSGSGSTSASGSGASGSSGSDTAGQTSGRDSVLGGTQVVSPVTAPVTIGGNALAVLGHSRVIGTGSGPTGAQTSSGGPGSGPTGAQTSGGSSLLGGTQLVAPIAAPITLGGNAVGVLGGASTGGTGTGTSGGVTPGGSDAGTNDPGTNDPGSNDSGTHDPGSHDPGSHEPGTTSGGVESVSLAADGSVGGTFSAGRVTAAEVSSLATTGAEPWGALFIALALLAVGGTVLTAGGRRH